MRFLQILFWCLLAFVAALFTYGNWKPVSIQLWSNMIADVNLPFLLLLTFLLGFLPTWAYYRAVRWRLRQRLAQSERLSYAPAVPASTPAYAPEDPTR